MSEEKGEELEEQITKTTTEPIQKVKDPKRVGGAGKRLAANNKRAREEAKARQKEEEQKK